MTNPEQLLAAIRPTLTRVVAGVLGSSHPDLEDAVQQSSLAFMKAVAAFRGECHPAGYASRIALRVALKVRRKSRREWSRRIDIDCALVLDQRVSLPSDLAEAKQQRQLLRELVATLPTKQSEALALRTLLGLSLDEVARATGVPSNTVRSRVRLAREALKRSIEMSPNLAEALRAAP